MKRKPYVFISYSPQETEKFGGELAAGLQTGDLLCLYGEIGAGKTTFVRGLARGLGIQLPVRSPTFTLIHEYVFSPQPSAPNHQPSTINHFYHIDLYRLESAEQVQQLSLEEYFERGICVIEWADRAGDLLPPDHLEIHFQILEGDTRKLTFIPKGKGYRVKTNSLRHLTP